MTGDVASVGPGGSEQLRLMAVASRLYHVHGFRQKQIGERLNVSQARVSRLLQRAEREGMVRRVLAVPDGVLSELEERVEQRYGVSEVHVVDVDEERADLPRVLGRAAARCLGAGALTGKVVGFTSWSTTLQELAYGLEPAQRPVAGQVVEMLGDLGSPLSQHAAARATQAMARALGAEPVFLRTPGVLATPELRDASSADPHVRRALGLLDAVDVALVGVGPAAVHSMLSAGDSYFTPEQLAEVRAAGAVGQLNQRFVDRSGGPVVTHLDALVVGSTLEQVRSARVRIVVAGGRGKREAIAAALRGGWVDVLLTDVATARALAEDGVGAT